MPPPDRDAPLTLERISPYLQMVRPELGRATALEKFGAGQSNPTYRLTTERGAFALRAQPPGELLKSAHQVDREHRIMSALAGSGVPAPTMLHLADADSPIGRKFIVMELVEGATFWNPALPELTAAGRARVYEAMNRTLAALHALDPDAIGLGGLSRREAYYARQFRRWRAALVDPDPNFARLIAAIERRIPEHEPLGRLVHGDWRIDNLIFSPDGSELRAVLDWELSTLGHPLADLAYQVMQWRMPTDAQPPGLQGVDRTAIGLPSDADYVAAYCARRGLDEVGDWGFHLAFSFFRMAAISDGVVRRAEQGNASDPAAADAFRRSIPQLVAGGLAALEERTPLG